VVDEIRKAGMAARSQVLSFDWRTLQVVQKEAPEIGTVYLTAQQPFLDNVCTGPASGVPTTSPADCGPSPRTAGFQLKDHGSVPQLVRAAGGRIWSPEYRDIDAAKLKQAHDLGLRVVVWTVNDPAQIARLIELGVDGIISDRPDLVLAALRR
jgi:glycerophosphoryl diester phosphodiesterase